MRKLGWETTLNYEGEPVKHYDRYQRLLDEMAAEKLNYLAILAMHEGYNYELSVGLAWPAEDPRIRPFRDTKCINADPDTEFLPRVIEEAHARGIEVDLNCSLHGGLFMDILPGAEMIDDKGGVHGIPCLSYEKFTELDTALVRDLIRRYGREIGNVCVDGYYGEGPTYFGPWHFNARSVERFRQQYDKDLASVPEEEQRRWKKQLVREHLSSINSAIARINPHLRRGQHCWEIEENGVTGHGPDVYLDAGIQFAVPGWHSLDPDELVARLDRYAAHMPSIVHISCRAKPPKNYHIPVVGPEEIAFTAEQMISYISSRPYPEDHIGVIYFNAENVPPENRKAVYASLRRIREECG